MASKKSQLNTYSTWSPGRRRFRVCYQKLHEKVKLLIKDSLKIFGYLLIRVFYIYVTISLEKYPN